MSSIQPRQLTGLEWASKMRQYNDAMRPITDALVRIMSMHMPKVILHPDGRIEQIQDPEVEALLARHHEFAKSVAESMGLPTNQPKGQSNAK